MAADSFHEKPLHIRQSKDLFGKGVKPGFAQLFRLRCDTLDGCATGDEPVRPLAPFSLFVVGGAVFKTLDFVLFLRKLPLHLFFLGLQLFPGTVGSRRHGGLPRAALDLRHMEMK